MKCKKGCFVASECYIDSECTYRMQHPEFKKDEVNYSLCKSVNCSVLKKYETEKCGQCFFSGDCLHEAELSKRDA